jgi:hypothetical protein
MIQCTLQIGMFVVVESDNVNRYRVEVSSYELMSGDEMIDFLMSRLLLRLV